jgi:dipeptidyl aminopeptidase/acylaminoacyl peptidase
MTKKRPISFEDLIAIPRISAPAPHPSGRYVAYVLSRHDHIENKVRSTIMLLDLDTKETRDLTPGEHKDSSPAWSPDGKRLAFVSDREKGQQLWILPFEEGGEAYRVTEGDGGVSNPIWAPDSVRIAFARSVVVSPHWDGDLNDLKGDEKEKDRIAHGRTYGLINGRSSARIETTLLYRHWDHWREMKRSHLFIMDTATKVMKDITPIDADVPPISLGGVQDFVLSPEGDEIAYVMNPDPVVAISTNNSVFIQKLNGIKPKGKPVDLSKSGAMELDPRYSPDGRYISFLGAEKPTYEADRLRVKLYDRKTKKTTTLTEKLDRSASDPCWSKDNIFFLAQDEGRITLYSVSASGIVKERFAWCTLSNLRPLPDGRLLVTAESMTSPADFSVFDPRTDSLSEKLTEYGRLPDLDLSEPVEFSYDGEDGDPVHGFLVKPPSFRKDGKYPLLFMIHGGPQSAFLDNFHYRWNPQLFASEGYLVSLINPRGSTGYGQKFTDQISGDWGGRCYADLMKGLEYLVKTYPFIDKDRMAALGASFGGFMVNWIAGHPHPFKTFVSHDGIFNQETMSYMTEELWFDIWEHGGMPHDNRKGFLKYSPHLLVNDFKTPMLVIQGEQDFRCPVSEGISLFTALQVKGIPSKFLYFPDEGHWVLKPANSQVWYRAIQDFLREHLG